jgi:antitoxin ParD1/3/4
MLRYLFTGLIAFKLACMACQTITLHRLVDVWQAARQTFFMTVTLPAVFESFVRQKIATGLYQDADEVVEESLGLMRQQESWKMAVTAKIDEGLQDMAEGRFLTSEESMADMEAFKANWRAKA